MHTIWFRLDWLPEVQKIEISGAEAARAYWDKLSASGFVMASKRP